MESAHASLRRLQTDYVDLYQAHRYDHETRLEETMRAFDDLVRQGKVLYVGVSEWRAEEISAALAIADQMGLDRLVSNQPQYNMLWRVIEAEVLPLCMKEGIGQVVWSPMAQGAHRQVPARAGRARRITRHRRERIRLHQGLPHRHHPQPGGRAAPGGGGGGAEHGPARHRLGA